MKEKHKIVKVGHKDNETQCEYSKIKLDSKIFFPLAKFQTNKKKRK